MEVLVDYPTFKSFATSTSAPLYGVEDPNGNYSLLAQIPGTSFAVGCILQDGDPNISDWTTNLAPTANVAVQQPSVVTNTVTTQFERTDINLQMARIEISISNNVGTYGLLVPGTFGVDDGRYVSGGYGMMDTYDPDDFLTVSVQDTDRIICAALGLPTDGTGDATVQGMGVLPGPLAGFGALPSYPLIASYADLDVPTENQGWYFYPLALGNNIPPIGELEIEPLGFYAHIPSGFYIVFSINRPNVATGTMRGDIFWGYSTTGQ
jgi:hypothetical protein